MRALCWNGVNDLRVETVADPGIINPNDAILKVRLSTTHRFLLEDSPTGYRMFKHKEDGCLRAVFMP